LKTVAIILFAFFMVWQPVTAKPEKAKCCGPNVTAPACCCVQRAPAEPKPVAPVPSRAATSEQITLLLPTISKVILDQQSLPSVDSTAASSQAAGVIPLFRRDCAILI
jgi:hypothetical protein